MNQVAIKVSKTRKVTYLGVQAFVTAYNEGKAVRGSITEWPTKAVGQPVEYEAGTFVAHVMKGKGHDARVVAKLVTTDNVEAEQWLKDQLSK